MFSHFILFFSYFYSVCFRFLTLSGWVAVRPCCSRQSGFTRFARGHTRSKNISLWASSIFLLFHFIRFSGTASNGIGDRRDRTLSVPFILPPPAGSIAEHERMDLASRHRTRDRNEGEKLPRKLRGPRARRYGTYGARNMYNGMSSYGNPMLPWHFRENPINRFNFIFSSLFLLLWLLLFIWERFLLPARFFSTKSWYNTLLYRQYETIQRQFYWRSSSVAQRSAHHWQHIH